MGPCIVEVVLRPTFVASLGRASCPVHANKEGTRGAVELKSVRPALAP
jgi:hypothetical protein